MIKFLYIAYMLIGLSSLGFAQNIGNGYRTIRCYGFVKDSVTKEVLQGVVINEVAKTYDHKTRVSSHVTDKDGYFSFEFIPQMHHRIELSAVGYKLYIRNLGFNVSTQEINCGTIEMAPDIYKLDEVIVNSRRQMFKVSGDTILYFPRSANTMKGDAVIEILKMMPGVDVQNGAVYIGGKLVERTYLNNKLIFGDDPGKALNLVKADDATLIQAYDEIDKKEIAVKGEKRAKKRKVLNIVTVNDIDVMLSAEIAGEGGLSSDKNSDGELEDFYKGLFNGGRYTEPFQMSLLFDKTNTQTSNVTVTNNVDDQTQLLFNVGIKPNQKHSYSFSYSFNNQEYSEKNFSFIEYFPSCDFNEQNIDNYVQNKSKSQYHDFTMRYEYFYKKIIFSTDINYNFDNITRVNNSSDIIYRDGSTISSFVSNNERKRKKHKLGLDFKVSRKCGKNLLELILNTDLNTSNGDLYRVDTLLSDSLKYDIFKNDSKIVAYKINPQLVYNIDSRIGDISLTTNLTYNNDDDNDHYTDEKLNVLDMARSRDMNLSSVKFSEKISYSLKINKQWSMSASLVYQGVSLNIKEKYPSVLENDRYFYSLLPYLSFRYSGKNRRMFYLQVGSSMATPAADVLSKRIEDDNPLFVSAGNPNVSSGNIYSLNAVYDYYSQKNHYFSVNVNLGLLHNSIINNRIYFKESQILDGYDNYKIMSGATFMNSINGDLSCLIGGSVKFHTPVRFIGAILKLNTAYSYFNPEYAVDNVVFHSKGQRVSAGMDITTNFSKKIKINIKDDFAYSYTKNNDGYSNDNYDNSAVLKCRYDFFKNMELNVKYENQYNYNKSGRKHIVSNWLDASVGMRLGKNENWKISLNAYDILRNNDRKSYTVTDQYVRNTSSNIITQFYSVSINLNLDGSK